MLLGEVTTVPPWRTGTQRAHADSHDWMEYTKPWDPQTPLPPPAERFKSLFTLWPLTARSRTADDPLGTERDHVAGCWDWLSGWRWRGSSDCWCPVTLGHIGHVATVGVTPDQVRRPNCGWFKSRIGFLPIKAAALQSGRLMLQTMGSAQMTRDNVPLTHQPGQTMESAQMTRDNVPLTHQPGQTMESAQMTRHNVLTHQPGQPLASVPSGPGLSLFVSFAFVFLTVCLSSACFAFPQTEPVGP